MTQIDPSPEIEDRDPDGPRRARVDAQEGAEPKPHDEGDESIEPSSRAAGPGSEERPEEDRVESEGDAAFASEEDSGDASARDPDAPWGQDDVSDDERDPRAGAPRIPGYRVHALIGRGATGLVFRATQVAVDRQVALKVLHPELVADRRAVLRLQREARLAARLAHPSIISAIDMGEIDGRWWYAMELVHGMSLQRRIATKGRLSERECLRLFSPLCDALQHAHEVGVVHRDIKPANVLIDRRSRARLVDLGLAMSRNDPSLTRSGGTLGTPHYVSPEQARDPRRADTRSDLWSLGATMYHAVCGRPPFQGQSVAEILSHVLHEPVPDPRQFAPELSRGFALMLGKCLTRDPERRYQEPWELVADIELLRERRRPDVRRGAVDAFASHRPAWISTALLGAGIAAIVAVTWVVATRPWEPPVELNSAAMLEDWPELVRIRDSFRDGRMQHAAALASLAAPTLRSLPDDAERLKNKVEEIVKIDLLAEVEALMGGLDADVDAALELHDFDRAKDTLAAGLGGQLRLSTGFPSVDDLPEGRARFELRTWLERSERRIDEDRESAITRAEAAIREAYPNSLGRASQELVQSQRWSDALALLDEGNEDGWLATADDALDLRGLGPGERSRVARAVSNYARMDFNTAQRAMIVAVQGLENFVDKERVRLGDPARLRGRLAEDPVARLEASFGAELERLSFDLEQLTDVQRGRLQRFLEKSKERLRTDWDNARRDQALDDLENLKAYTNSLRTQRRYGQESRLWQEALDDGWHESVHQEIRLRLCESELLEEIVRSAAAEVNRHQAPGHELELLFPDRIRRSGVVRVGADDDVAENGFELRVRGGLRARFSLLFSGTEAPTRVGQDPSTLYAVVDDDDLIALAGLDRPGLTPRERLQVAAFRSAEGDPIEAWRIVPDETGDPELDAVARALARRVQTERGESLLVQEERRVARQDAFEFLSGALRGDTLSPARKVDEIDAFLTEFGAELEEARRVDLEARREAFASAPPEGSFEAVFGVSNESRVGKEVVMTFDCSDPARSGKWDLGVWRKGAEGFVLEDALPTDAPFKGTDSGPHLPLRAPLNPKKSLTLRVRLRADSNPGRTQLFAITIAGYHFLMADGRGQPRAWFGSGDLWRLTDIAGRIGERSGVDVKGFFRCDFDGITPGEPFDVEIALRPDFGAIDHVRVAGKELDLPTQYDKPTDPLPYVYIRSREPATMLWAQLEGRRH